MTEKEKVAKIINLLESEFKIPVQKTRLNPLDNLVLTILSQSTNDKNRDHAYERLRQRYPNWEDVINADVSDIKDAIKIAGLGNQKSVNIKNILIWIKETFGQLKIDFLCDMNPDEAIKLFCTQKGIGIKTMAVVLCFSCGVDVFAVDTHVHRICRRLGLVPDKATPEKTFYIMKDLVPRGKSYSFHLNLLKLGRTICLGRKPKCDECMLTKNCLYYSLQKK